MARSRKRSKPSKALLIALVIIVALVLIAAVIVYAVKPEVYHIYLGFGEHTWTEWETENAADCGNSGLKKRECTVCGETESEVIKATGNHTFVDGVCTECGQGESGTLAGVQSSDLSIHFLELGNKRNGDSILIKCGDTEVLIDAGSDASSAPAIKSYISEYVVGKLDYVISTHADSDHIAAFVGSTNYTGLFYDEDIEIGTLIKFDYTNKALKTASGKDTLYKQYLDAVANLESNGTKVYTASQCYNQTDGAKRQYYLNEAQTVSINVLYNYYYFNQDNKYDENDYSVVTLLTEKTAGGKLNYLFTGDLEEDGESRMVDYYKNVPAAYVSEYNVLPEVELFKAGHHGSGTSSTEKLLNVIKPKNIAICCCCGAPEYTTDPANVFPYQITCNRLMKYTDNVYVTSLATGLPEMGADGKYVSKSYSGYTSMNGNIVFYTKNGKLFLYCTNNDTILKETEWFKQHRTWNGA